MKRKRRKNKIQVVLLIFVSLFLIPVIYAVVINFPVLFSSYTRLTDSMLYSLIGFVLFLIIYYLIGAPVRSYIVAHELSHVIFAFLTGVKVKNLSIKKYKSFVKTSGSNVFISLGPYILPFYSIIIILIYKIILFFTQELKITTVIFYLLAGAGYSFHILTTIHYLRYDQPDMKRYGYFFSITFVVLWIVVISALLFSLMFSKVKLLSYLLQSFNTIKDIFYSFTALLINVK